MNPKRYCSLIITFLFFSVLYCQNNLFIEASVLSKQGYIDVLDGHSLKGNYNYANNLKLGKSISKKISIHFSLGYSNAYSQECTDTQFCGSLRRSSIVPAIGTNYTLLTNKIINNEIGLEILYQFKKYKWGRWSRFDSEDDYKYELDQGNETATKISHIFNITLFRNIKLLLYSSISISNTKNPYGVFNNKIRYSAIENIAIRYSL